MDLAASYHHVTDQILVLTGWTDKMAHLNAGMAIYVLTQLLLRTRRASLPALAMVAFLELGNEALDALFYGELRVGDSLSDIAYTLCWPAIITFIGMHRRERWNRRREKHPSRNERRPSLALQDPIRLARR
ncbi:hypothetical protein [Novosphingobium sp.]|uniref:hypothetical protein n=1 Tax=Novosphingobium sp. TaxID=1874826 RepID=UPI002B46DD38|nr:hypothetical protein [Novosphingobium sp.]HKR91477.1 hypothetical protein [Novosphingobium sp.]